MTFHTLRPWMRRNAIDEDCRNADWDTLLPKACKARKASVAPPRLTMPAAGGSRVTASPSARPAAAVLTAASTPRAPVAAAAGRKRGRDTAGAEGAVVEAAPVREVVVEMAPPPRPRKRALLVFSEGEDEGDVPPAVVCEAPPVAEELAVEEEAAEEVPAPEEVVQEAADLEETTEARVEEETEEEEDEEDEEMIEAEERPGTEEPVASLLSSYMFFFFVRRMPLTNRFVFQPPRSSVPLSQDSVVVTALPVAESANMDAPSPLPVSSGVLTEIVVVGGSGTSSAVEEAASPDDLESLFASLHEEGGSSALAPLDEDYKAVLERLREFLLCDAYQMTTAEAFIEFRACLDEAMAMGLLDSAQLDELQLRLAEGEEMLGRCAEASMRMTEGCLLEQELAAIKEQVQPIMARLKESDLVVRKENEELAQVEAQIAELEARRSLILQRRNGAAASRAELKSSARQILKAAGEKKKALAERKLIRAKWQADINSGDIAWRKITCLVWGMFSEGV
ncbi:unnamed protein product [Prunus brigantina]